MKTHILYTAVSFAEAGDIPLSRTDSRVRAGLTPEPLCPNWSNRAMFFNCARSLQNLPGGFSAFIGLSSAVWVCWNSLRLPRGLCRLCASLRLWRCRQPAYKRGRRGLSIWLLGKCYLIWVFWHIAGDRLVRCTVKDGGLEQSCWRLQPPSVYVRRFGASLFTRSVDKSGGWLLWTLWGASGAYFSSCLLGLGNGNVLD